MSNQYRFITRWRVQATPEEVFAVISQPFEYPRWWPSVYLAATDAGPGRVRLLTRGWLPYTLKWEARTVLSREPNLLSVEATGDLTGRGIWSIVEDGAFADITFDWKVAAKHPLIEKLSFLLRPAFEANHRWAMAQGLNSLELELRRYRAGTVEESNAIPAPPPAVDFLSRESIMNGALAAGLITALVRTRA